MSLCNRVTNLRPARARGHHRNFASVKNSYVLKLQRARFAYNRHHQSVWHDICLRDKLTSLMYNFQVSAVFRVLWSIWRTLLSDTGQTTLQTENDKTPSTCSSVTSIRKSFLSRTWTSLKVKTTTRVFLPFIVYGLKDHPSTWILSILLLASLSLHVCIWSNFILKCRRHRANNIQRNGWSKSKIDPIQPEVDAPAFTIGPCRYVLSSLPHLLRALAHLRLGRWRWLDPAQAPDPHPGNNSMK